MRPTALRTAAVLVAAVCGLAGCGSERGPRSDAGPDAGRTCNAGAGVRLRGGTGMAVPRFHERALHRAVSASEDSCDTVRRRPMPDAEGKEDDT